MPWVYLGEKQRRDPSQDGKNEKMGHRKVLTSETHLNDGNDNAKETDGAAKNLNNENLDKERRALCICKRGTAVKAMG